MFREEGQLRRQARKSTLICSMVTGCSHVWAVVPLVLVSLTSARNAHYAIHAMIPWSVWSALGLARSG